MRWLLTLATAASLGAIAPAAATTATLPGTAPSREAILAGAKDLLLTLDAASLGATTALLSPKDLIRLDAAPDSERTLRDELRAEDGRAAGTRTTTLRGRTDVAGSRVTATSQFRVAERRGDWQFNLDGRLTVRLDFCPDASGRVPFEFELTASGDSATRNAAGSGGFSMNYDAKGAGGGNVNDAAVLAGFSKKFDGGFSIRGGANVSAGPAGGPANARNRTATASRFSLDTAGTLVAETPDRGRSRVRDGASGRASVTLGKADDANAGTRMAWLLNLMVDEMLHDVLAKAQDKWRGGACVEIAVAAPLRDRGAANRSAPGELRDVNLSVRHTFEKVELAVPIDAELIGKQSLAPRRIARAPGVLAYTAGSGRDDYGRIELKTVSRRGIGENTVLFDNSAAWHGEFKLRHEDRHGSYRVEGNVTWRPKPGSRTEFVPAGGQFVFTYRSRGCSSEVRGEFGPDDGVLDIEFDAQGRPLRYEVSGLKPVKMVMDCGGATVTADGRKATVTSPSRSFSATGAAPMQMVWLASGDAPKPVVDGRLTGEHTDSGITSQWNFRQ